jgi:hypothetical protein
VRGGLENGRPGVTPWTAWLINQLVS